MTLKRRLKKLEDHVGPGSIPRNERLQIIMVPYQADETHITRLTSARMAELTEKHGTFDKDSLLWVHVINYSSYP